MAALLNSYTNFLRRSPVVGNMVSSGVLFATGDVVAQQLIEKKGSDHDLVRTGRIVAWGGLLFAPTVTVWFRTLERYFPTPTKGSIWPAVAKRVALDQFVFAPCILTAFFSTMTFMEGKGIEDVKKKWSAQFVPTLQTNWKVFIPVQTLNMAFVPLQYRLLLINGVNIPWNAYLSLQNQAGVKPERAEI